LSYVNLFSDRSSYILYSTLTCYWSADSCKICCTCYVECVLEL